MIDNNQQQQFNQAESLEDDEMRLPPRRVVHPSGQDKLTKWYYRLLLLLFFALTIGLIFWGRQFIEK